VTHADKQNRQMTMKWWRLNRRYKNIDLGKILKFKERFLSLPGLNHFQILKIKEEDNRAFTGPELLAELGKR
jgi:hypothetical protein